MSIGTALLRSTLLASALFAHGASAETLRMGGTGAVTNVLPAVLAAFDSGEAVKLQVIPSLGTTGGLRALNDGLLDVAVSGRPLKPEEIAFGLKVAATIRTPFVLATSHPRPDGFKSADLAKLFASPDAKWADGAPIRLILRPKSESDTTLFGGLFPGMAAAIETARKRPDVPVAGTDQDNVEMAERVPGSIAGASLAQIQNERVKLQVIAIDGVEPSLENFARGAYPFPKNLYFVLPAKPKPEAERFIAFLHSPAGEAVLRATGSLPAAR